MAESKIMTHKRLSSVKSKNSKMEMVLRRKLFSLGYRYRIHYNKIVGKPDLVFSRQRLAIFCDSNFWHGYKFEAVLRGRLKTNKKYWEKKILTNIQRDKIVNAKLKKEGWKVLRFWEHQIEKQPELCIRKIKEKLIA